MYLYSPLHHLFTTCRRSKFRDCEFLLKTEWFSHCSCFAAHLQVAFKQMHESISKIEQILLVRTIVKLLYTLILIFDWKFEDGTDVEKLGFLSEDEVI